MLLGLRSRALAKKGLLLGSGKETHIFAKKGFQVYSPKAVSLNGTKDGVEIKQSPMNFIMIDKKLFEARCGADGVINIGKQLDIKAEHVTFGEPKDGKGEMPAKKETPRKGRLTSWRAYTHNTLIGDSNNTIVLHTGKSKSEGYWIQLHEKDGICLRKGPKKNDYPQIILTDKMVSVSFNKDVRCRVNKKSAMLWNKGTKVNVFDKKIQIEGKKVEVNGKTMVVS